MADRLDPAHRHRRNAVVAVQAAQLLDHIRLHGDVMTPGRRRNAQCLLTLALGAKPERMQVFLHHALLQGDAGQPLELLEPERERPRRLG